MLLNNFIKKGLLIFLIVIGINVVLGAETKKDNKSKTKTTKTTKKDNKSKTKTTKTTKKDNKSKTKTTKTTKKTNTIKKQRVTSQTSNLEIEKIKIEISKLKNEVDVLKKDISKSNNEIKSLSKKISSYETKIIETIDKIKTEDYLNKKHELSNNRVKQQMIVDKDTYILNKIQAKIKTLNKSLLKKDQYKIVDEGTLNWKIDFPIRSAKYTKGKWSISVLAEDDMGNVSKESAINIKIDPKSDIPIVNVINPVPLSRVPGNLTVVGTAYDDDAVDYVSIKVDNAKEVRCTGREFWYYDIKTTDMQDGKHKVTLKSYDIKGIPSKPITVYYNLDRKTPKVLITSMISGDIVSGKFNLAGSASDMNGIQDVEYSIDNRDSFVKVSSLKYKKGTRSDSSWSVKINTNDLVDGTQTIWVKAIDFQNSEGYAPLTVTVDHKIPTIDFQYPKDKQKVDSQFVAFGFADDNVKIKKVSINISGSNSKPIPVKLMAGNRFWKQKIDMSKLKAGRYTIEAIVEDVSGNTNSKSISVDLDINKDKPTLDLVSLKDGDKISSSLQLYGPVHDDDEVKEVIVHIFKAPTNDKDKKKQNLIENIVPSRYSFATDVDLSDTSKFKDGQYVVEMIPVDIYGTKGNVVSKTFWIDRAYPVFDAKSIKSWQGKLFKDGKITINLKVLKNGDLSKITYSILDKTLKNTLIKDTEIKFKQDKNPGVYLVENEIIDLQKAKIKYNDGLLVVKLNAIDSGGKKNSMLIPVVVDSKEPTIKFPLIDAKKGMLKDGECIIDDALLLKEVSYSLVSSDKKYTGKINKLNMGDEKEIVLNVKGKDGKFIDYTLSVSAKDLAGYEKKSSLKINFKDTKNAQIKLVLKVPAKNRDVFSDKPIIFVENENFGLDSIGSTLFAFLPTNYTSATLSYNGITKNSSFVNNNAGIVVFPFSKQDQSKLNAGQNSVTIKGQSDSGEDEIASLSIFSDTSDPIGAILWPPSYTSFNNDISIIGNAFDDSGTITVKYSLDGKTYKNAQLDDVKKISSYNVPYLDPSKRQDTYPLKDYLSEINNSVRDKSKLFKVAVPIKQLKNGEKEIIVKIRDGSGKEVTKKIVVIIDKIPPKIKVWTPTELEKVNGEITIRGEASDNYFVDKIVFIHNDKEIVAEGRNFWDGLFNLNDLIGIDKSSTTPVDYTVDIFALDLAGNKQIIKRKIKVDSNTDKPAIYINSPAVDNQRYTGNMEFAGIALDDDGIKYVQYRIDHGKKASAVDDLLGEKTKENKYKDWKRIEVEKGIKWSDKIAMDSIPSGKHTLEVQAIDIYGLKSDIAKKIFQLDLENPLITFKSPGNGDYLEGVKRITGSAVDPNEIKYVDISTNYGWTFVRASGTTQDWNYELDSRSVPDGRIRVLVKAVDKAGSESFAFRLFHIDNTPPEINVLLPKDDMSINDKYTIVGRAKDNIGIKSVKISIKANNKYIQFYDMEDNFVEVDGKEAWSYEVDTNEWTKYFKDKNGNVTSTVCHLIARVEDKAGNIAEKSLNFKVDPRSDQPDVVLDQPQLGQHTTGDKVDLFGTASDDDGIGAVYIKLDDNKDEIKVFDSEGYIEEQKLLEGDDTLIDTKHIRWHYSIPAANLEIGPHKLTIIAKQIGEFENERLRPTKMITKTFYYDEAGPIVKVLSHENGAPMEHRPWLIGTSYYYTRDLENKLKKQIQHDKYKLLEKKYRRSPEKIPPMNTIKVSKYEINSLKKTYLQDHKVTKIFLSLDNGKTFERNYGSTKKWRTRVQTQYLIDGPHMLQIKAVSASKDDSIRFFRVFIDRHIPQVIIDSPVEKARLNEKIIVRGSADDNGEIKNVKVMLRKWDKNQGKVPKFIQGLYLWAQAFGGSIVSGGIGLSFFDDIVRVEGAIGWTPTRTNAFDFGVNVNNTEQYSIWNQNGRYNPKFAGLQAGGKLLARILDIPFEFFFGEDARNFSISVSLGAGFFWYSGDVWWQPNKISSSDTQTIQKFVAELLLQADVFKIERLGPFRKFALYVELGFYFVTSDVVDQTKSFGESIASNFQIGFGLRNSLF